MTDYMSGNPNKAPLEPYFLGMGEGERNRSFNMLVRNVAKADQTGREFGLIEMSGVKGLGAPPHSHGNEAESFFGLEGTVRVWVGEQDALVHPGDFVFIPRHLRHKFRIESEYAKFLCLITPGSRRTLRTSASFPASRTSLRSLRASTGTWSRTGREVQRSGQLVEPSSRAMSAAVSSINFDTRACSAVVNSSSGMTTETTTGSESPDAKIGAEIDEIPGTTPS